jgi:hypothetical protein
VNLLTILLQESLSEDEKTAITIFTIILAAIITLVFFVVWLVTVIWVYRDANRRGKPGIVVALLVGLISWPIGLLVWVLVRNKV